MLCPSLFTHVEGKYLDSGSKSGLDTATIPSPKTSQIWLGGRISLVKIVTLNLFAHLNAGFRFDGCAGWGLGVEWVEERGRGWLWSFMNE